jgi:hypothetical protein
MALFNIHEDIGWYRCANLNCRQPLGHDHVVLLTTAHLRRFCSVECIAAGQKAWQDAIYESTAEQA